MSRNLGNNILMNFEYSKLNAPKPAVDTTKRSYLLVNQPGDVAPNVRYGQSSSDAMIYLDWDLDGNGKIRQSFGDDAKSQTVLKMIFTEKQEDGYGTHIFDYIGIKDIGARRLSMFMDFSLALLSLKANLTSEASRQGLSPDDLISTVSGLSVSEDEQDPRAVRIRMSLVSSTGSQLSLTVL